jgi:predicted cupin superfamily sugar epimerase
MIVKNADYWINHLNLLPHPEGGFYKEIFSSIESIDQNRLHKRFSGSRKFYTSIYFLLRNDEVSHFHRIKSDEIWTFHTGSALDIHIIDENGTYSIKKLGLNPEKSEMPQQIVKAGTWFAASLIQPDGYALVGCFVSPGFDFADFELGERNELIKLYPKYEQVIKLHTV